MQHPKLQISNIISFFQFYIKSTYAKHIVPAKIHTHAYLHKLSFCVPCASSIYIQSIHSNKLLRWLSYGWCFKFYRLIYKIFAFAAFWSCIYINYVMSSWTILIRSSNCSISIHFKRFFQVWNHFLATACFARRGLYYHLVLLI